VFLDLEITPIKKEDGWEYQLKEQDDRDREDYKWGLY
jgi:hypothetical protein